MMGYTLSNLLRDLWDDLGQTYSFVATGGSTSTALNGNISIVEEPPEDNYCIEGSLLVERDAGGASAAPEGEFGRISAYAASTYTYTVDTALTIAVAAGDTVMVVTPVFPLRDMIRLANMATQNDLGEIALVDVSLTTAANQTEYALPLVCKGRRPLRVQIQGTTSDANANQYFDDVSFDIVPAVAGSTGLLVLPQYASGYTIKIWYLGVHSQLTAYSSVISETIPRPLLLAMMRARAIRWYNNKTGGSSEYWMQMHNEAKAELDRASVMHKVWKPARKQKILTFSDGIAEDDFTTPASA
jgi:hypothetical protein